MAAVLLSAGAASALLTNANATCEGIGVESFCVPSTPQPALDTLFVVSDENEGLFNIIIEDRTIVLTFPERVTGEDLDTTGFHLTGLVSFPDPIINILSVDFDFWNDIPITSPFVTNDGGVQGIQWTALTGGDSTVDSLIRINLVFVPEPGTALLMGLGLAGLGTVGRSRREASEGTA